ncbi:MAG: type II toxin-antitoxin system VapC family toxin [Hyphomicrobiales bacterium]|nr:type II toxin-antitoxin system VapC family toxin [Hyphomicrobiales bacterium]
MCSPGTTQQIGLRFSQFQWSKFGLRCEGVRVGDIDVNVAAASLDHVQSHLTAPFIRQLVSDPVIDTALEMVDRYALRAYDALQLADCLVLCAADGETYTFVCSDHRLLDAARSEHLQTLDPAA